MSVVPRTVGFSLDTDSVLIPKRFKLILRLAKNHWWTTTMLIVCAPLLIESSVEPGVEALTSLHPRDCGLAGKATR